MSRHTTCTGSSGVAITSPPACLFLCSWQRRLHPACMCGPRHRYRVARVLPTTRPPNRHRPPNAAATQPRRSGTKRARLQRPRRLPTRPRRCAQAGTLCPSLSNTHTHTSPQPRQLPRRHMARPHQVSGSSPLCLFGDALSVCLFAGAGCCRTDCRRWSSVPWYA